MTKSAGVSKNKLKVYKKVISKMMEKVCFVKHVLNELQPSYMINNEDFWELSSRSAHCAAQVSLRLMGTGKRIRLRPQTRIALGATRELAS